MDFKTPGSGESARNFIANLAALRPVDAVKFVICDRDDYDWSKRVLDEHGLAGRCEVLFSPSWQQLDAAVLAGWILADELPVRFQVQLHKLIWGDVPGR
jgi:7-carboxy-7-deazaguanine synthase